MVTRFGFAGEYVDEASGYQYLRARFYDPVSGQFLSVDPLVDQTREPYAYTAGNPLQQTDPLGLAWWNDAWNGVNGALDAVTFGGTKKLREWTGTEHWVDECSTAYRVGYVVGEVARDELVGVGVGLVTGGVGYAAYKGYKYVKYAQKAQKAASAAKKVDKAGDSARAAVKVNRTRRESISAREAPARADGIVYKRTDINGGKPYIGQAKNEQRFRARQMEHARKNPEADFEFQVVGREEPGVALDRLEEYHIRLNGGPTNKSNPYGGLENKRHQMNDKRYNQ